MMNTRAKASILLGEGNLLEAAWLKSSVGVRYCRFFSTLKFSRAYIEKLGDCLP